MMLLFLLLPSFMKISQRVSELLSGHKIVTRGQIDGRPDRQTDGQSDYYKVSADFVRRALIMDIYKSNYGYL